MSALLSPLERLVRAVGPDDAAKIMQGRYGASWQYQWRGCWARPKQLAPPGNWRVWFYKGGRGSGKTRTAAEWVRERVEDGARRIALVGRTSADGRDVLVEGEGGILSVYPPDQRPLYEPSKRRVTWKNGAVATTYSAEDGSVLRGPQHDTAVADELAAWYDFDAWDQLMFGLRLGSDPRVIVTTTPRPRSLIKALVKEADDAAKRGDPDARVRVTSGSTYENLSNITSDTIAKYEGTRLGRQEIYAEILEDAEGALWNSEQLESLKVQKAPPLHRAVVGVDPSKGKQEGNDEQGIVAVGIGTDRLIYVLEDATCKLSPDGWGGKAVELAVKVGAGVIVVERNAGGDMARAVIEHAAEKRGVAVRVKPVLAKTGKGARAEPIAALYEQNRVRHLPGLEALEDEMVHMTPAGYDGDGSPNRVDSLTWATLELVGTTVIAAEAKKEVEEWLINQ